MTVRRRDKRPVVPVPPHVLWPAAWCDLDEWHAVRLAWHREHAGEDGISPLGDPADVLAGLRLARLARGPAAGLPAVIPPAWERRWDERPDWLRG